MEMIEFTQTENGPEGLDLRHLPPEHYTAVIWRTGNLAGWHRFYRGVVLPEMVASFIEETGVPTTLTDMHDILKNLCNGGRSTAKMTAFQWRHFIVAIQAVTLSQITDSGQSLKLAR